MDDQQIFTGNFRTAPPVKKRRRKSVWRGQVWPIIKVTVLVLFVATFAGLFADKLAKPLRLYIREYRATQELASEVSSLKKENAELERQIRYLQTPKGAAQAARKLGYVKPGEVTLILPDETLVSDSARPAATSDGRSKQGVPR